MLEGLSIGRFTCGLVGISALLTAAPLPVELTGAPPNMIKLSTSGPGAFPLNNGGGGFAGTVWKGTTQTGQSYATTMWCVDSQLFFSSGNSGLANITLLSNLPSSDARYSSINDSNVMANPNFQQSGQATQFYSVKDTDSDAGWTNSLGGGVFNAATVRFQMAAWLVQKYTPFPAGPAPANDPVDAAIQRAIWAIMHNTTPGADGYGSYAIDANNSNPDRGAAYWLNLAKASYNDGSVNLTKWAVVSWLVDINGVLVADDRQTFLVQITPEPGFYAVLGIGLALLVGVNRRRQRVSC